MTYYTEKEIKEWFKIMKEKYTNCPFQQNLQSVEDTMFDEFWEKDNLKKVLDK